MKQVFIVCLLLIPTLLFAETIKNNNKAFVVSMHFAEKPLSEVDKNTLELFPNPFNIVVDFVSKGEYYASNVIGNINDNLNNKDQLPYETLFLLEAMSLYPLFQQTSPVVKWCEKNQNTPFSRAFFQYKKEQINYLETAYNLYKIMAQANNEPFNINIDYYKKCISNGNCKPSNKKFLRYD